MSVEEEIEADTRRKMALFERKLPQVSQQLPDVGQEIAAIEPEIEEEIIEIAPPPAQKQLSYRCKECGKEFPVEEFATKNDPNKKAYAYCRECNRRVQKKRMRLRRVHDQVAVRELLIELSGGKCARCGYSEFNSALEFHHIVPGDKEKKPSDVIDRFSYGGTQDMWDGLVREISKCVLLCSNCHQALHVGAWVLTDAVRRKRVSGLPAIFPGTV